MREAHNSKFKIQNSKFKIGSADNSKFKIQNSYSGLYPKLSSSRFELRQSLSTFTKVCR